VNESTKQFGKSVLYDQLSGFIVAFGAAFAASAALGAVGASDEVTSTASLFLFFVFVMADPLSAWRGLQSGAQFFAKIGAGVIVALVLAMLFNLVAPSAATMAAVSEEGATQSAASFNPISFMLLLPFVIIPIVFMGPVIERILAGKGPTGDRLTWDDLQIAMTFPLYMSAHFILIGAIAVALWLMGVGWTTGFAVLIAGVVCAVADSWTARPDDALPDMDEDETWVPRAENAAAAWNGLRKALRVSVPSVLFLGGMIFSTIALAVSISQGIVLAEGGLSGVVVGLLEITGIVLAASLGLMLSGAVLAGTLAYGLARRRRMDRFSIEDVAMQSLGRLFMGGMAYVRPDMDEKAR
jgi:hypothetical protein